MYKHIRSGTQLLSISNMLRRTRNCCRLIFILHLYVRNDFSIKKEWAENLHSTYASSRQLHNFIYSELLKRTNKILIYSLPQFTTIDCNLRDFFKERMPSEKCIWDESVTAFTWAFFYCVQSTALYIFQLDVGSGLPHKVKKAYSYDNFLLPLSPLSTETSS